MKSLRFLTAPLFSGLLTTTLSALTPLEWAEIPDTSIEAGQSIRIDLSTYLSSYNEDAPRILIATSQGDITLQLRPDWAPATVANFLDYLEDGDYDDSLFHRSVPGFIIQTGGYKLVEYDDGTAVEAIYTNDPVENEFSESNVRGTIAMAKVGGDPDSATCQWFINLADNSSNLDNQNGGFTVFGEIDENGMAVADAIADLPRYDLGNIITEFASAFGECPLQDYTYPNNVLVANLVQVPSASILADDWGNFSEDDYPTLTVSENSASSVLEASIDGSDLVLTGLAVGEATITIRASSDGLSLSDSAVITVTEATIEPEPVLTDVFSDAIATGNNWWYSDWYGFLNGASWPWIFTEEHGWQYVVPAGADSMWLYDVTEGMGWLWTAEGIFPSFYHSTHNEFIVYSTDAAEHGWYYFPSSGTWELMQ